MLTSVIQPKYVGDAVGISVSLTLVALVFWGWLLGTVGAVLAVPLTLFAKALIVDVNPRVRWANAILGSTRTARDAMDDVGKPPGADDPPPVRSDGPWAADSGTSMMNPSPGET